MPELKATRSAAPPRRPERKYGPFHGGVGVAVWLNQVDTDDGPRFFRTATISPRRFRDEKSGEWKDASSLRSTDLAALILGLQAAHQFMLSTPLPGEPIEESPVEDSPPSGDGVVPF